MQVAAAVTNIVRAEREYDAAVVERAKAQAYESEAWHALQAAREAGRDETANGPLLTCGHHVLPREWARYGPEAWCDACCCWREKQEVPS